MLHSDNIADVAALEPDYMGFIFYPRSVRYAGALKPPVLNGILPASIRRVGVFVDAEFREMVDTAKLFGLSTIQLHGAESPYTCMRLRDKGYEVIKAFGVEQTADLLPVSTYEDCCDLFLFDTKTVGHGGSGRRFDWRILDVYKGKTPFLLSGGISPLDADEIKTIGQPALYGVDLNSRFEVEAGLKNTELLERFIKTLRS